jgi:hypothetical protein
MTKPRRAIGLALVTVLLAISALVAGATAAEDFDDRLEEITDGFRFDFVRWEINTLDDELRKLIRGGPDIPDDATDAVIEYFANAAEIKRLEAEIAGITAGTRQGDLASAGQKLEQLRQTNSASADLVERVIESQVREVLIELGIDSPLVKYTGQIIKFPPVNFTMDRLPHLLVISPRDRIESIRETALLPEMTTQQKELIEAEADKLGVSSLVVGLGGIATYPNFVSNTGSLRFVLNTICEEWLHQYLTFTPLGFRYLLDLAGIKRDYEIATMNETVAGIVSKEIGEIIYDRYYAVESNESEGTPAAPSFDFNKEMREIRIAVDAYLLDGEIETAEEFMEEKRQYLADNGYIIRKLNQAYFAFHGAYADAPTSVSPIGSELRELRNRSTSLKDFLDITSAMTGRQDLIRSIE